MSSEIRVLQFLQDNTKNKPNEDFLHVSGSSQVFTVADGITRSVEQGREYPTPSPASLASKAFCLSAELSMRKSVKRSLDQGSSLNETDILSAFRKANSEIAELNETLGIIPKLDYFENDLAGCVAVLGVLDTVCSPPILRFGYIGDCGLLVFNQDLNPVFLSDNSDMGPLELFRENTMFADKKERMIFWREKLRNRPNAPYLTYGSLTGEEEALAYVRTGSISLEPGLIGVLFSDGILPYIFHPRFRAALRNQLYSGDESPEIMRKCIDILTKELDAKHVHNLDDDKAFIPFCIDE